MAMTVEADRIAEIEREGDEVHQQDLAHLGSRLARPIEVGR